MQDTVSDIASRADITCMFCGKKLKRCEFDYHGHSFSVPCWGSCGCKESMVLYDDVNAEMTKYDKYRRAMVPEHYIEAVTDISLAPWYICGGFGTSKTQTAAALIRKAVDDGRRALFASEKRIFDTARRGMDEDATESERRFVERCQTVEVLAIDDIGKERPTEWGLSMLFGIIDARYSDDLMTIITSNYERDELAGRFSKVDEMTAGALLSRLHEMTDRLDLGDEDRRL